MKCYPALCLATLLLTSPVAMAGTKTVTFGWEDGTSTILGSFSNGDADGNTVVDGDDLVVWQNQFGTPAVNAAVSTVPEPASIGLFGLGLGLISPAVCRRRRA